MFSENPRIAELRRRIQEDPASIAFAQLAEEYRRAGQHQEAVSCCRDGLQRYPDYLSARVTLGRSLLALGAVDDAEGEFQRVLASAPETLAALRGMAEIEERRGALDRALDFYKRALSLARFDPELEGTVDRIDRVISQPAGGSPADPAAAPRESSPGDANAELPSPSLPSSPSDFDALLKMLGVPGLAPPPQVEALVSGEPPAESRSPLPWSEEPSTAGEAADDPLEALERRLRAFEARAADGRAPTPIAPADIDDAAREEILAELEAWLAAIVADRARERV